MNNDRNDDKNDKIKPGFFQRLKELAGFSPIEDNSEYDDYDSNDEYEDTESQPSAKNLYGNSDNLNYTTPKYGMTSSSSYSTTQSTPKVYPIKGGASLSYGTGTPKVDVIVVKATSYGEGKKIVEMLKKGKIVILNMEKFDIKEGLKLFEFCVGAICVLDGKSLKVSDGIFILAPSNVYFTDSIKDELRQKGIFDTVGTGEE